MNTVMTEGRPTDSPPTLGEIRGRFEQDWLSLDTRFKALVSPPRFPVQFSPKLQRLTAELREQLIDSEL